LEVIFAHGQTSTNRTNLGQVFNFRSGHLHAAHKGCYISKLPNLKLKTQPKQLLSSLPLDIGLTMLSLLGIFYHIIICILYYDLGYINFGKNYNKKILERSTTSGQYYKHVTIVIGTLASSIIEVSSLLTMLELSYTIVISL
jgi:hypothetical protein